MAKSPLADLTRVRNLGVIAHIDAGKTTTTEHLLYYAGAKHKLGGVDEGTTDTDYDPEEQERGITIYSACIPFSWRGFTVNLIDTPGHVDFTAEVERSLRVLDGAICVFDAQKGVEAQSETVWRQANKYLVPRVIFINKMDVVGANFVRAIQSVRDRLAPDPETQGRPVPIVVPVGSGSPADSGTPFAGVIDLIDQQLLTFSPDDFGRTVTVGPVPEDYAELLRKGREELFDVLTAFDDGDAITSLVLEGQDPPTEVVRSLVRELTLQRTIYPVLCGSGREHIGIQPLLDAVTYYLPSPLDRPPVTGINPKTKKEETRKPDPKEPFCGLVFKAAWHPNGHRFFVRVYSGVMKPNTRALNPLKDMKENVAKLFHVHADPNRGLEEVDSAPAGDIVAVIGLKESATGDTLCETAHPIVLEAISFADAVVSQSIEPDAGADKDKLGIALAMLQLEDPTFKVRDDKDTAQKLMSGMGTLHLEVKRHRLERDFKLKVRVGKPRVSYRETLGGPRDVEVEVKTVGQREVFARLGVQFTALKSKTPVTVTNFVGTETLPVNLAAAAETGLRDALQSGGFGFPMMDVQARIVSAAWDATFSNEDAFLRAAVEAYREATRDNTVLLEPIMRLIVTTPDEFLGNVTGDLAKRGGLIERTNSLPGAVSEVEANVALSKLFDYADRVRSLSQGRASSTMEPLAYEPAPQETVRQLLGD